MKRFSLSAFLIGLGLGMIFSYFFVLSSREEINPDVVIKSIPDEIVIQRAKELGLIDPNSGIDKEAIQQNSN